MLTIKKPNASTHSGASKNRWSAPCTCKYERRTRIVNDQSRTFHSTPLNKAPAPEPAPQGFLQNNRLVRVWRDYSSAQKQFWKQAEIGETYSGVSRWTTDADWRSLYTRGILRLSSPDRRFGWFLLTLLLILLYLVLQRKGQDVVFAEIEKAKSKGKKELLEQVYNCLKMIAAVGWIAPPYMFQRIANDQDIMNALFNSLKDPELSTHEFALVVRTLTLLMDDDVARQLLKSQIPFNHLLSKKALQTLHDPATLKLIFDILQVCLGDKAIEKKMIKEKVVERTMAIFMRIVKDEMQGVAPINPANAAEEGTSKAPLTAQEIRERQKAEAQDLTAAQIQIAELATGFQKSRDVRKLGALAQELQYLFVLYPMHRILKELTEHDEGKQIVQQNQEFTNFLESISSLDAESWKQKDPAKYWRIMLCKQLSNMVQSGQEGTAFVYDSSKTVLKYDSIKFHQSLTRDALVLGLITGCMRGLAGFGMQTGLRGRLLAKKTVQFGCGTAFMSWLSGMGVSLYYFLTNQLTPVRQVTESSPHMFTGYSAAKMLFGSYLAANVTAFFPQVMLPVGLAFLAAKSTQKSENLRNMRMFLPEKPRM